MTSWQPINTVPKHGRGLLYFGPMGHIEDASFHQDDDGEWFYELFDGEMLVGEPTHWMPLPEPPND